METTAKLVKLLRENARLTDAELAAMLDIPEKEVAGEIARLEREGIIAGYTAIINEEKFDTNTVTAFVELKVSLTAEYGYSKIAETIAKFDEVDTIQLISGDYDLAVTIKGGNLRDVAEFVQKRLASLEEVKSTATHFVLERFKEKGELFENGFADERIPNN
jgi:DNA-binding Lrp family transcriptional regulator